MKLFNDIKSQITFENFLSKLNIRITKKMIRCPFHNDTIPSMIVNDDFAFCFACGERSDIIRYYSQLNDLNYTQAAKEIADMFEIKYDKIELEESPEFEPLTEAHKKFLYSRGITDDSIDDYRLAALGSAIVFPISKNKKYKFHMTRDIYRKEYRYSSDGGKSEVLMGLDNITNRQAPVVVVESYIDSILAKQEDLDCVALGGCVASEQQIKQLKDLGRDIILALDNDKSGLQAQYELLKKLIAVGVPVYCYDYSGKDFGECLYNDNNYVKIGVVMWMLNHGYNDLDIIRLIRSCKFMLHRKQMSLDLAQIRSMSVREIEKDVNNV
jgi:DNA primase